MGIFDFNNNRAQNLSDPKFEKDSVNLRTLKLTSEILSASTISAATIIASAITISNQIIFETSVLLTAGQIQSGNTIPIDTGIQLPGLGKAIEVVSASIIFTANTTAFLSTDIYLITDSTVNYQAAAFTILSGGINIFSRLTMNGSINNMADNKLLLIQTDSNSIGTGDGEAKVYIAYRIITV